MKRRLDETLLVSNCSWTHGQIVRVPLKPEKHHLSIPNWIWSFQDDWLFHSSPNSPNSPFNIILVVGRSGQTQLENPRQGDIEQFVNPGNPPILNYVTTRMVWWRWDSRTLVLLCIGLQCVLPKRDYLGHVCECVFVNLHKRSTVFSSVPAGASSTT